MKTVTAIGLDIAKSVFQVHGVDAAGKAVIRRQLRRAQVLAFRIAAGPDEVHRNQIAKLELRMYIYQRNE